MTAEEKREIEKALLEKSTATGCAVGYFDTGKIIRCKYLELDYMKKHELAVADARGLNGNANEKVRWFDTPGGGVSS